MSTPFAPAAQSTEDAAALAAQFGMSRAGARPPMRLYLKQLWGRRNFIAALSSSNNAAGYSRSMLGQAWQVLTPLLNAAVYFLIFGLLLHTKRGVHNYIAFLVVGLFTFHFMTAAVTSGAKAISSNLGIIRSLHFPRAVLPTSTTFVALLQLLYSLCVAIPIVIITGERPQLRWLELVPALILVTLFALGIGYIFARVGAHLPDTSQLLPFVMRVWMYTSGVMYSIDAFTQDRPAWVGNVLSYNPGALYIDLARHALIDHQAATLWTWVWATLWAVFIFVVGFLVFWQGEEEYGRV